VRRVPEAVAQLQAGNIKVLGDALAYLEEIDTVPAKVIRQCAGGRRRQARYGALLRLRRRRPRPDAGHVPGGDHRGPEQQIDVTCHARILSPGPQQKEERRRSVRRIQQ
jgi:hypothetical protein